MQAFDSLPIGLRLGAFVIGNVWAITMIVFWVFERCSGRLYKAVKARESTRFALINLAEVGALLFSAGIAYQLFHTNKQRVLAWGIAALLTFVFQWAIYLSDYCDEWTRWRIGTEEGVGFVRDRLADRLGKRLSTPYIEVGIGRRIAESHYSLVVIVPASLKDKIPTRVEGIPVSTTLKTEPNEAVFALNVRASTFATNREASITTRQSD